MSGESSQLSRNPVRIVYHAENRTFARLFNEHTLDGLKDVVRRKLSLGRDTDVSLKQMGPDTFLDLDDDDDFEAFRVLLRSRVSVDIQVVVGRSQGRPVRSRTSVHFEEPPRAQPSPVASSSSRSKELAGSSFTTAATESTKAAGALRYTTEDARELDHLIDEWIVASESIEAVATTQESTATEETPPASTRKRRVSTSDTAVATTRAASKATATEEPAKKRQRKETVKVKDGEDSSTKASPAPKTRTRKSVAADKGKEAGISAPKDAEASKSPSKMSGEQNKDDSIVSNEHANPSGIDQPISQPGNLINDGSLQLEEAPVASSSVRGSVSRKTRREPTIGVCAAVPRTSESATVQTEVAAAILSMASEIALPLPPPPPRPKRKYVRKDTKMLSAPSAKSKTVSHSANQVPNVPTEQRPEPVIPTNAPLPQTRRLNGPSCPICEEEPFHIRYYCPIVSQGPDAIRERLEEVRRTNAGNQQSLIKELESLLRDPKVTSEPSSNAVRAREVSPPSISVSRVPNIPGNSNLSEVTVEDRDEGSSSESSDDVPEEVIEQDEASPAPGKEKMPDRQLPPSNDDLDAVIRGPTLKRHSILNVLDRIVGDEDGEHSDSEVDQVQDELEDEDTDEEIDRSRRRVSKYMHSSDSESEDEESRSPSPSHSDEDGLEPGVRGSNTNNPVEESTERQGDDVVMEDGTVPSVPAGQGDDNSEETHVGSEDRMAVDDPIREKGTVIVAEQRCLPAARTTALQPSDASSKEPQESGRTEVNQDVGALPNEAEADPIEPADDLEPPTNSRSLNADPIELLPEDISTGITQSTPNPGVTNRIKNRNGQTLDDEAEPPVLVEQLTLETTADVTPLSTKAKSRRKVAEKSVGQEPTSTRKSPRFGSLPPAISTPAAVALLNHRAKVGVRSGKTPKTPAKRSDASQSNAKNDNASNGARIAATPSLVEWETLAAPSSSPSIQLDEPLVLIDELMSSSPQQDDRTIIPARSKARPVKDKKTRRNPPNDAETPQEKQRLFDLTSSQIPFPYSQHKKNTATSTPVPNGKEREERLDLDSEREEPLKKTRAKSVQYRSLSQLASQATLFSPSLPTPATRSVTNAKTKKRVANKESSSSSEEEEEEEGNGSEHIPQGRRAGSVLETKKKSVLSRLY